MYRITLNIPHDMPDEKWATVDSIYREMPGWRGYGEDGCPSWELGDGHTVSASLEPSGLCLEGSTADADIKAWVTEFMARATAGLGFSVEDAEASRSGAADRQPRIYCIGVPNEFESVVYPVALGLLTLFVLLFPLWQLYRDEAVFWEILYALGPLGSFAYFFFRGVDRVRLFPDGEIVFERVLTSRSTSIDHILRIRPWLGSSRRHFVVELDRGAELLMGDPGTVAYLARALKERRPEIGLIRVPQPPS